MIPHGCPYCTITSNRKYNMKKHIERKHPDLEIPNNLLSVRDNNSKDGKYGCLYCTITSNRKYNMKKHIERKHPDLEIPNNLLSVRDNYNNNGYIHRELPQNFDVYVREKHKPSVPFHNTSFLNNPFYNSTLPIPPTHKKDKNFYSIIWEMSQYIHLIKNLPNRYILPTKDFSTYNPMLNLNFLDFYKYYPVPSIDLISWNKEILFRVQRCDNGNTVLPIMCDSFDNINYIMDCRCNNNWRSQKQNNEISYLTAKEFLIKSIISFIDKEKSSKIYLKCIKIHPDIYTKLVVIKKPFFYNNKENGNIPSWLMKYIMDEEFVDLGVIDHEHWAYRLTNSNDKSIEITKSDLIEFINYGDSTFGLFIFHEDNISISFFSYLQIERIENT
jgi:hypothetical protein